MSNITFEDVVAQIKDRLDILDIISKDVILKKSGGNYWGLCPFHKEKTPSFTVNPAKGIYKCFGCGEGGDALSYLMKTKGIAFKDLIIELAQEYGIEIPTTFAKGKDNEFRPQMIKACAKAVEFYQNILFTSSASDFALQYLNNRGITEDIIKKYGLGFALKDYDALYKELKQYFSNDVLEKAGLILPSKKSGYIDRFRNRIIIPIHNENGDVVAFGARAVEEGQNPKYLNSSDSLIYNKSKILYGLYFAKEAIKEADSIIIMEGYFDVISSQAHGIKNCVASCGTSLTADHIKIVSRYTKSRKIYLSFDTDNAGINAANRGAEIIKDAFKGLGNIKQFDENYSSSSDRYSCEIRVVTPPEGKDPDEFMRTVGAKEYMKHLEHAPLLIDFQLNNILRQRSKTQSPTEKMRLVKEIIPILAEIGNDIVKTEYVKMVASTLNVDEKALSSELNRIAHVDDFEKSNVNRIVTKSSNIIEKTQKNLLSLYLVSDAPLKFEEISEKMSSVEFENETLKIVKSTIDKLTCIVNDVKGLTEKLYTEFAQDTEKKEVVTDLICISEAFYKLSRTDFETVIDENINKIDFVHAQDERKRLRNLYTDINNDDNEALKIQMQIRDKLKKRTIGDY